MAGGNLGSVGERIIQELRLLQEALGDLGGLKEALGEFGKQVANQFAKERPKVWEEEWDMEYDEKWVKRECEELLAEKEEYHEYLKRRGEMVNEVGNWGRNQGTEGELKWR
jgi:hypothetical protein